MAMELARGQSGAMVVEPEGESIRYCNYCGSPLNHAFYFCTSCSTPYKHPETVLPGVMTPYVSDGTRIALRAPAAMRVFWTYFAVVLGSAVVAAYAFDPADIGGRLILGTVAIAVTTCIVAAIYWRSLAVQLKRVGFDSPWAWFGLAMLMPMLGLNYLYHHLFLQSLGPVQLITMPDWSQLGLLTVFCIFPAISEELAFRGLLQHWMQAALTPMRAVVIASALFAGMHFSIISFPYLFCVGMLLGWTKLKTGSLYPSMPIHFLHNLAVIELLTSIR
jgi:membrane protease YdiL (CAAX protease family)